MQTGLPARALEERLHGLSLQVREIRALLLIDGNGLPLVSTLHARALEESLAAFGAAALSQMMRAAVDLELELVHLLRLSGSCRQVFVVPVYREMALLALVEPGATAATMEIQLLAMAREILDLIFQQSEGAAALQEPEEAQ